MRELRIKIGDRVLQKSTDLIGYVENIQEECGYVFVTLAGVVNPLRGHDTFGDVDIIKVEEVEEKNQYKQMVESLETRLKKVKEERMDIEDKLNDLEYEENHLIDAIDALKELN